MARGRRWVELTADAALIATAGRANLESGSPAPFPAQTPGFACCTMETSLKGPHEQQETHSSATQRADDQSHLSRLRQAFLLGFGRSSAVLSEKERSAGPQDGPTPDQENSLAFGSRYVVGGREAQRRRHSAKSSGAGSPGALAACIFVACVSGMVCICLATLHLSPPFLCVRRRVVIKARRIRFAVAIGRASALDRFRSGG